MVNVLRMQDSFQHGTQHSRTKQHPSAVPRILTRVLMKLASACILPWEPTPKHHTAFRLSSPLTIRFWGLRVNPWTCLSFRPGSLAEIGSAFLPSAARYVSDIFQKATSVKICNHECNAQQSTSYRFIAIISEGLPGNIPGMLGLKTTDQR